MSFQIVRNDITRVKADAIVSTANPLPLIGKETDSAIYAAAGEEELLAARERIGVIEPGNAAYTDAFRLNAKYIIHTVGPRWIDGEHGEKDILHVCYRNALYLAEELACRSIAFPLIASGNYGFPKDLALEIALQEIRQFLLTHEMKVTLVVFDRKALELSQSHVRGIREYLNDGVVLCISDREHRETGDQKQRRGKTRPEKKSGDSESASLMSPAILYAPSTAGPSERAELYGKYSDRSLDKLMERPECTFQKKLFQLIDASGMTDVEVYKRANLDRKVFSSIRCNPDYRPKKKTAIALAIALRLDMLEMVDLLARAEIAFSPDKKSDLIIMYFVEHRIYDIFEINAALFHYGQPTLGC